jgi:hypothetical protein
MFVPQVAYDPLQPLQLLQLTPYAALVVVAMRSFPGVENVAEVDYSAVSD